MAIGTDTRTTSEQDFPHAITDPGLVPVERYISAEFARLENERLWPRVWQAACRLEEIPRVGDYAEYTICDQSILIVRVDAHTIKAYFNACRHRATALGAGSGTFHGGRIVCPYHGWRWDLQGVNTYVYAERGFRPECLEPDYLRLRECQVDTLFGMVFINMDPDAAPLAESLGDIAQGLGEIGFERMQVRWWRNVILPANWKMAQEAFMEAYHVMQAHPSLAMGAADEDYDVDALSGTFEVFQDGSGHVSRVSGKVPVEGMSLGEYFITFNSALYFGTDAYTTEREMFIQKGLLERDIPEEEFPKAFFRALYDYAQGAGIELPSPSRRSTGYGHIFPNITVLPAYGNSIIYRVRPYGDNPEMCVFEVWAVQIPSAEEHEASDRPAMEGPVPIDEWPQIFKEDFQNIERQQKGLHTKGLDHLTMSERYEPMIINHHRSVDEYLARG